MAIYLYIHTEIAQLIFASVCGSADSIFLKKQRDHPSLNSFTLKEWQKISKRRIRWNFLQLFKIWFCSKSLLYIWLHFSVLKNEIQAVLSPKVHSTMRAMYESELWEFYQCHLKVIPASQFYIAASVGQDGDSIDMTESPELPSLLQILCSTWVTETLNLAEDAAE